MLAMKEDTNGQLGCGYRCSRYPGAGRSRMGCCPRRPTCWRRGRGVEASRWEAAVGSANEAVDGVIQQYGMVWWFRVVVQRSAQYWIGRKSAAHSPMPACSQAGHGRCESCHDLMT